MPVRSTMSDLIALERTMIGDPAGASQQFNDLQIQDRLDASRDDIGYELLDPFPSIVNTASTNNQAAFIFADYYSKQGYWESDVVLQGLLGTAFWKVLTPVVSELLLDNGAHWQFEASVFTTGTVPGQLPPVFATGKVYDVYSAAAALLEYWAVTLTSAYDFTSDGQSFHRSQLMKAKLKMADYFRRQAKPKVAKMIRMDVAPSIETWTDIAKGR